MTDQRPLAIATAAAKNYVPFARVLSRSLAEFHPDVPVFLGLTDELDECFDPATEPFELVPISRLEIPDLSGFAGRFDRLQAAIAAKPFVIEDVLDRGFRTVVYIDVDVLVLGALDDLFSDARSHAITLVPHLLEPPRGDDRVARELNILQSGVFNGGVVGVTGTPVARRFLRWLQARVQAECRHAADEGLHYDQRWLDLVPSSFDDVHVVRDPALNVAHWNVRERDVGACRLFHFSGYDPDHPDVMTRHLTRATFDDAPELAPLFRRYRSMLLDAGWDTAKRWPYSLAG